MHCGWKPGSLGALWLLVCSWVCNADAAESFVVPPQERVAGKSQAEWSRDWWQWAGSFPNEESPIADRTGGLCAAKQSGPVWFLAGTYGPRRTMRTCTVPPGKYLFFPLINYVVMPRSARMTDCGDMIEDAAAITDEASLLVLEIDGVRINELTRFRQATDCFDMGERAFPRVRIYPSAANGYYVMLKPLPPGTHTLNFGGSLPRLFQAVTYTLTVE
jgi:hypothetical protein